MAYERVCKQCSQKFEANRDDAVFCSAKCVAQYYRDNDNPDYIHAYKQHIHAYVCDECQQGFFVNDYAKRGGKRAPRFCSPKCKQKAYRERVQQQAARRQEQEQRASGQSGNQNHENKKAHRSRGEKRNPYDILGVKATATRAEIRKAWMRLIKKWHPDVNPDNREEATRMSQDINWAYNTLFG